MKSIVEQLEPVFNPGSIAVIGASETPGKWGHAMIDRPLKAGYGGTIYPVNDKKSQLFGLRAYPSILDIPGMVDLAVITTPMAQVADTMRQCVDKEVKGAVIISAGFAEVGYGGKALQDEVVRIARDGGIRFVGPNCNGLWNAKSRLNLCFDRVPLSGPIAFVSQSGTYGGYLAEMASEKGYGLGKFVGIGNQADVTASDYLEYLAQDDDTRVIVFYIEGFREGARFFRLAKEVIKSKPIVIYKGGVTSAGARAAQSHSASLAGSAELFDDMCRQAGVIRAQESFHSFEMAEALIGQPLPRGRRVAIVGSGGQGVVASDACVKLGLEVPQLDEETSRYFLSLLPPHSPLPRNPVDSVGSYQFGLEKEMTVLDRLLSLDYIDCVITNVPVTLTMLEASLSPTGDKVLSAESLKSGAERARQFAALCSKRNKPVVCLRFFRLENDPVVSGLAEAGIPTYETPEQCARALYALVKYAEARNGGALS